MSLRVVEISETLTENDSGQAQRETKDGEREKWNSSRTNADYRRNARQRSRVVAIVARRARPRKLIELRSEKELLT